MSSYGSLPTLDSAVSTSDCEKTDAGSRVAHSLTAVDAEVQDHVYKSKLKKKLGREAGVPPYPKTLGGVRDGDTGVPDLDNSCFVMMRRDFYCLEF